MPVILVSGDQPGAGTTTVAVGLAHRLSYAGHSVRLERLGGDASAERDAGMFAVLESVSTSGRPVAAADIANSDEVVVVDGGAGAAARTELAGARLVHVHLPGGAHLASAALDIENRAMHAGSLAIPEDRLLAAPTVGDLVAASKARVLARSTEGERALCEHIVIGAISHDSNQPYFARFPRTAVVTRAEKVDIALSALRTNAECLILTGGSDPSPYLLDRVAASRGTTLLVAPEGTVETVRDIEGMFGGSAFAGEVKAERIGELTALAVDDAALEALLGA